MIYPRPIVLRLLFSCAAIFIVFCTDARAQPDASISGRVTEAGTNTPLPGVNVYLTYSTRGASTGADGQFTIQDIPPGTYELAASMIGYETVTVQIEVSQGNAVTGIDLRLKPAVYELDNIVVAGEKPRGWQRNLDKFRELFLGASPFAGDTEILNPYALDFEYAKLTEVFSATAKEPLVIENRALGYTVIFELKQFSWDPHQERYVLEGLPHFKPMPAPDEETEIQWEQNREAAWRGSTAHLFQSMVQKNTFKQGFTLTQRLITHTKAVENDELLAAMPKPGTYNLTFEGLLDVQYWHAEGKGFLKRNRTGLHYQLQTQGRSLTVDADGFISPQQALLSRGYPKRIAELLPREYGLRRLPAPPDAAPYRPAPLNPILASLDRTFYVRSIPETERISGEQPDLPAAVAEAMQERRWKDAAGALNEFLKRNPQRLEARYLRAIAYREIAKSLPYLDEKYVEKTKADDWSRSESDFQTLIEQDRYFRDVLYQYALLKKYQQKYEEAVELAHQQLQLQPAFDHVAHGLFDIYRAFIYDKTDQAMTWLADQDGDLATYFLAEAYRLKKAYPEAERLLQPLLESSQSFPIQAVQLSLAKINYAKSDPDRGEEWIQQAIATIDTRRSSDVVFDDVAYIATPEEWSAYQSIEFPDAYRHFFEAFWLRRDPMPSLGRNERMTEHYRRLAYAEQYFVYNERRIWSSNPAGSQILQIPSTYLLNEIFNDKGVVYIRHGEPDERVVTITPYSITQGNIEKGLNIVDDTVPFSTTVPSGLGNNTPPDNSGSAAAELRESLPVEVAVSTGIMQQNAKPNESWRYTHPEMDFHFVVAGGGANWRLVPIFPLTEGIIEDRAHWGGRYGDLAVQAMQAARETPLARPPLSVIRDIMEESRQYVWQGLTTDRHSWTGDAQFYEFPYLASTFRTADGNTSLEIFYELPLSLLTSKTRTENAELEIEQGCALYTTDWKRYDEGLTRQRIAKDAGNETSILGSCRFEVPADAYRVSLHTRPIQSEQNLLGGYRFDVDLPDYAAPVLHVSDILPAFSIEPATTASRFSKGDLYVRPNPQRRFSISRPLHLYYEIYNLTYGPEELTEYEVTYTFTRAAKRFLGINRDKTEIALSISFTQTDRTTSPVQHPQLDVSNLETGEYTLSVKVRDIVAGEERERLLPVTLLP